MKRIILAAIAAAVMLPSAASAASSSTLHHREHRQRLTIHRDVGTLRFFRNHRWLAVTPAGARALRFARAELGWTRREIRQTRAAIVPPLDRRLVSAFSCIHHYEGSWDSNTGNGYYGGLQMDRRFQSLYGREFVARWGTADHWPIRIQLQVAIRAYKSGRGFYPWPNTARSCGLI